MVGTVDLQGVCGPASDDVSGLWAYLQQVVGQPFLFFRQSYADELTLHLGTLREAASPKLRRRVRGSYVLTLRGSVWALLSGPQQSLTLADPALKPHLSSMPQLEHPSFMRQLELDELEKAPPIEPGAPVVWARPYPVAEGGGFELLLEFGDQSRLMVRPCPTPLSDQEPDDLPEIADWELFTPYGRYLRVGPGPQWAYLPSGTEAGTVPVSPERETA